MDEETTNVELDTTTETVEETEETPVVETEEVEEKSEATEVDIEQLQATNKKLYERAKKAEADLKATKGTKPVEAKPASTQPSVEETVLLANGMPEELVTELKAVAQVRGTTLLKAQADPIFVAVKEKFEKDAKVKDASLPASRGAGGIKAKKDFKTPGLTREEHKKMHQDAVN